MGVQSATGISIKSQDYNKYVTDEFKEIASPASPAFSARRVRRDNHTHRKAHDHMEVQRPDAAEQESTHKMIILGCSDDL